MFDVIASDGSTAGLEGDIGFREGAWHCITLFEMGGKYAERANSIIRSTEYGKCHFIPMNFTQMLRRFDHLLDDDVREKMTAYVKASLDRMAADRIHISMYNDNFANMAIYTLLVAGEIFDMPEYFQKGMEKLEGVADLFRRNGALMEFGSNTYTPIDTLAIAEIAEYVKDEKAQKFALMCEERMWVEITTRYHPGTPRMAGPHSRAYSIDTVGHPHLFSGLAWFVFGDRVFSNPVPDLFEPHEKQVMHGGLENLTLPNIAWIINTTYHCPEYLAEHAFNKKYPYETKYMTGCIPGNIISNVPEDMMHEYGGWRGRNYTYMTRGFAMGTAMVQFHGGALSESFYITYRNKDEAKRIFDTGAVYSRYIFNYKLPGQANEYNIFGKADAMAFRDEGRKISVQDKGTALVTYKPKQYERGCMKSAKLSMMIPVHFFDDLEIHTDSGEITGLPYSSKERENVYVGVHESFFAFIPLEVTDLGRDGFLKIEKANDHILISFYNYEGPEKSLTAKQMILSSNGFACVARAKAEDMDTFISEAGEYSLKDEMQRQEGSLSRRVRFKNGETELSLMYSPLTEGVFVNTVNKKPVDGDIIKADGLDENRFPFINDAEGV
jgi:hypothetical protein